MYSEDVATSLIVVGDQIFEVRSTDEMEQPYYIVNGGKDFSFIMSVDEDGNGSVIHVLTRNSSTVSVP